MTQYGVMKWHKMVSWNEVNISTGNCLLPDSIKPLPVLMLTQHTWSPVTFIWGWFFFKQLRNLWQKLCFNSLWSGDTIWQHWSGSTLVQVMACCLTAPSHYLNQYWQVFCGIRQKAISQEVLMNLIQNMCFEITSLKLLPRANELTLSFDYSHGVWSWCMYRVSRRYIPHNFVAIFIQLHSVLLGYYAWYALVCKG